MTTLRRRAAALALAASLISPAHAAARVYLMRGLCGWLVAPMMGLAIRFRAQGDDVSLHGWTEGDVAAVAGDICRHPASPAIIVGHSLGGPAAIDAAQRARACGARHVRVISIDPPANGADARGVAAVNFVGALGGTIAGARNIAAPGHSHFTIADDLAPRIVAAAR